MNDRIEAIRKDWRQCQALFEMLSEDMEYQDTTDYAHYSYCGSYEHSLGSIDRNITSLRQKLLALGKDIKGWK